MVLPWFGFHLLELIQFGISQLKLVPIVHFPRVRIPRTYWKLLPWYALLSFHICTLIRQSISSLFCTFTDCDCLFFLSWHQTSGCFVLTTLLGLALAEIWDFLSRWRTYSICFHPLWSCVSGCPIWVYRSVHLSCVGEHQIPMRLLCALVETCLLPMNSRSRLRMPHLEMFSSLPSWPAIMVVGEW